jgi:hypothetical protein
MIQYIMERNFNIVYDQWENENPIPNIKKTSLDTHGIKDPHNLILHYYDDTNLKSNRFKIRRCKISDINTNEKFYYIISYSCTLSDLFFYNNTVEKQKPLDFLSDEIKNLVSNNDNFFIMFLSEHEPDDVYGYECLINYINQHDLPANKFYLVNNNSKLIYWRDKFETKINVYKLNFIPHSSIKVLTRIGGVDFLENKVGKFFMCFNKSPKKHRYGLLLLLMKNKILDQFNWSLVPTWNCNFGKSYLSTLFDSVEINILREEIEELEKIEIKKSDFEVDEDYFRKFDQINREKLPLWIHVPESLESYRQSYFNITTESMFENLFDNIHISEKSFKPFYYYQFPLILSSPHHIKKMREEYGLDFFDDIINHEYDNIIDDKKRLSAFVTEIIKINGKKEQYINFYKENKNRFEENKKKVESLLNIVDKDYLFL